MLFLESFAETVSRELLSIQSAMQSDWSGKI